MDQATFSYRMRIVQLARECVGTPFSHEGRIAGSELDCAGPIVHVWHGLGFPPYRSPSYGRIPRPRRMIAELDEHLERIAIGEAWLGDVLHLAWAESPQHLAIITDKGIIHSHEEIGRCVEHGLDSYWRGRIRLAFRFPVAV